ncbi:MAG: GNAT family N-acetyltransferase [Candidatus Omnitrophica bacterium]|nr:GNAT family N-acetyltransferase [Candidatus Omnitrophota bacterium]
MIYGKRIRFRGAERSDLPTFVRWVNDPEVLHGVSMFQPMSLAREEKWFEAMLSRPPEEQVLVIEIKKGTKWMPIGTCGFHGINWRDSHAEMGILIGEKKYWGKGYGQEAMTLLMSHGFDTLNLHRLELKVFEDNPRAIHAYEKIGLVHEGRLRQAEYSDGAYKDVLLMGMLRSEWNARKKSSRSGRAE